MKLTEVDNTKLISFVEQMTKVPQNTDERTIGVTNEDADKVVEITDALENSPVINSNRELSRHIAKIIMYARMTGRSEFLNVWLSGLIMGIKFSEHSETVRELERVTTL